ncbi:amidase [Verrucomicrobiota bacterium sgz303538]
MIETRLRNARASFSGLLLAFVLTGCSELEIRPARDSRDRTFISSGPTSTSGGRLRLAVKDNIDVKGYVTSAGSEYLFKNTAPAVRDAECMAISRARNVQIVGKTNLTEFALSVSGINGYFGTPWNPIDERRRLIPGGSSSGSAVAVASGQADVAFGTDTAGSIRVPAACCGVAGLKTTFGLISLDGVFPIAPQYLDTVGPLARDIHGLVQGMELLQSGFASRFRAANASGRDIRVARLYVSGTDRRIDKAVDDALAAGGFQVVVLNPEFREEWEQAERDARTVATANGWANDRQYLDKTGVSAKTKTIIAVGKGDHGAEYREALQRRVTWQRTLEQLFQKVDFIAVPTLKQLPPEIPLIGRSAVFEDRVFRMQNTAAVNLAGNPALAMPIPVADKNIPVTSLQLIGRPRSEAALLNAGRLIEAGQKRAENQAAVVASR